jgi:hypothetical protein
MYCLFGNYRLRLWNEIRQCRWFSAKTLLGVSLCWKIPTSYSRSCFTIVERNIAMGQKEAVTAMLARFVPVHDHDGTLLTGPTEADFVARTVQLPKGRTRFGFQFDLQTLLLFVVVVSCAASSYGIHCRRHQPHHMAVTRLERFGPTIDYLISVPVGVDFSNCTTKPTDDDLVFLESLDQLSFLILSGSPITDAGLEHLKELRYLRFVDARDTGVTSRGAEALSQIFPDAAIIYGPVKKPIVLKPRDQK